MWTSWGHMIREVLATLFNAGIGLSLYGNSCTRSILIELYLRRVLFLLLQKINIWPLTRHLLQLKMLVSRKSRETPGAMAWMHLASSGRVRRGLSIAGLRIKICSLQPF